MFNPHKTMTLTLDTITATMLIEAIQSAKNEGYGHELLDQMIDSMSQFINNSSREAQLIALQSGSAES